jgi:predicted TIM-barrel fold metal-dependent hydrolase
MIAHCLPLVLPPNFVISQLDHRVSVITFLDNSGHSLRGRICECHTYVKLSGIAKITPAPCPYAEAQPFVDALLAAYTPERRLWASDWPYLRATTRMDYGVLLRHIERALPDPAVRRQVLWDTPRALFGFAAR